MPEEDPHCSDFDFSKVILFIHRIVNRSAFTVASEVTVGVAVDLDHRFLAKIAGEKPGTNGFLLDVMGFNMIQLAPQVFDNPQ